MSPALLKKEKTKGKKEKKPYTKPNYWFYIKKSIKKEKVTRIVNFHIKATEKYLFHITITALSPSRSLSRSQRTAPRKRRTTNLGWNFSHSPCLFLFLSVRPSASQSVCLFLSLSIYISIYLSLYISLLFPLSLHPLCFLTFFYSFFILLLLYPVFSSSSAHYSSSSSSPSSSYSSCYSSPPPPSFLFLHTIPRRIGWYKVPARAEPSREVSIRKERESARDGGVEKKKMLTKHCQSYFKCFTFFTHEFRCAVPPPPPTPRLTHSSV